LQSVVFVGKKKNRASKFHMSKKPSFLHQAFSVVGAKKKQRSGLESHAME
jgi:hypothetical protein